MNTENKKYKLLKDLPYYKEGEIKSADGWMESFKFLTLRDISNLADWFELVTEPKEEVPERLYIQSDVDAIRKETFKSARLLQFGMEITGYLGEGLKYPNFETYLSSLNLNTNDAGKEEIAGYAKVMWSEKDYLGVRYKGEAYEVQKQKTEQP